MKQRNVNDDQRMQETYEFFPYTYGEQVEKQQQALTQNYKSEFLKY